MKYWTTELFEKNPRQRRHTLTLGVPLRLVAEVFNDTRMTLVIIDESWMEEEKISAWDKNKTVKPYHRYHITFMWQHVKNYSFNLSTQYVKQNRTIYSTTGPLDSITLDEVKKWCEDKMLGYYKLMADSMLSGSVEITARVEKITFKPIMLPVVPNVETLKPEIKNFWQKILKTIKRH